MRNCNGERSVVFLCGIMYVMTLNIAGYMVLVVQRLVNVKLEGIRKEVLSSN
jgi:hypothetical protein